MGRRTEFCTVDTNRADRPIDRIGRSAGFFGNNRLGPRFQWLESALGLCRGGIIGFGGWAPASAPEESTRMNAVTAGPGGDLANKIARLVEERGWNQEDFARISKLNRHTVRQILHGGPKRQLRNATVSQCAKALGLTVSELRNLPLERLLTADSGQAAGRRRGPQTPLRAGRAARPRQLARAKPRPRGDTPQRRDPGTARDAGSRRAAGEDRRRVVRRSDRAPAALVGQVKEIAGTEYLDLLEQLVRLMYDKVKPRGVEPERPYSAGHAEAAEQSNSGFCDSPPRSLG